MRKVGSPNNDGRFISWARQPRNKLHLTHFVTFYTQERNACLITALAAGDTDFAKGQVDMLDQILTTFEFLADTEGETGVMPDTDPDTAKE